MEPISVLDALPEDHTYVLVRYNGGNWIDSDDTEGCTWIVAKFVRGFSLSEREQLSYTNDRRNLYRSEDEYGNNLVPYRWGDLFGQDVDYWCPLPKIKGSR